MTTALLTHEACLAHETPSFHAERPERLSAVLAALEPLALARHAAPEGRAEDILRCHPQSHLDALAAAVPADGIHQLDADTWISPGSLEAARRGVGAITSAIDMVLGGEVQNAFCATRPPGHHAETRRAMGFCLFGTVAIGAKYALDVHGLSRVAVVDFDVHHGNGTQDLLWDEPRALVVTSQQLPLWPETGERHVTGGQHNVLNLPLPPESDGAQMRALYEAEVFPRLEAFAPELLLISAGFDAHRDDPLAQLRWTEADYTWLTERLCAIAARHCGGRVVSALEGGYNLTSLAASAAAHVAQLVEAGK